MTTPAEALERCIEEGAFVGAQLVVAHGGKIDVNLCRGELEPGGPPVTTDTLYDLASLTKPLVTAALAARLVEEGRWHWSMPMAEVLSDVDPRVRLDRLLSHSAGYPAHRRFDLMLEQTVPGSRAAYDRIVHAAATTPLAAAPGTACVYSDIGYIILGAAIEVAQDASIAELFREITTDICFFDARDRAPTRRGSFAPTQSDLRGTVHDDNCRAMGGVAGHAGTFGTAEAVTSIALRLLEGFHGAQTFLKPETIRRLWTPADQTQRTLGWDRPSGDLSAAGDRWPSDGVGHLGFTGTSLWIAPKSQLVATLLTNRVLTDPRGQHIRAARNAIHNTVVASAAP